MVNKATVTGKGQITIPKDIREKLGLEKGEKVVFEVQGDETVMYPEIEEPTEELRGLRDEITFSRDELEEMRRKSEDNWDQIRS